MDNERKERSPTDNTEDRHPSCHTKGVYCPLALANVEEADSGTSTVVVAGILESHQMERPG